MCLAIDGVYMHVYGVCSSSYALSFPFAFIFLTMYFAAIFYRCANDFIVYNITFLRKIESTNLARHPVRTDTCCQGAFSRVRMNPRWISSLQGSKTSVPRIKSKKIREGRGLATEGGRERKEEEKVDARSIHILWSNHQQPLSTVCSVLSFCSTLSLSRSSLSPPSLLTAFCPADPLALERFANDY